MPHEKYLHSKLNYQLNSSEEKKNHYCYFSNTPLMVTLMNPPASRGGSFMRKQSANLI